MQQFSIKISLKSFESSTLQATKDKIEQFCYIFLVAIKKKEEERAAIKENRAHNSFSYLSLPSRTKKFTLLRSPHIDKKSREQFERHTYKGQIQVLLWNRKVLLLLLFLLKNSEFPGIELTVSIIYPAPFYS